MRYYLESFKNTILKFLYVCIICEMCGRRFKFSDELKVRQPEIHTFIQLFENQIWSFWTTLDIEHSPKCTNRTRRAPFRKIVTSFQYSQTVNTKTLQLCKFTTDPSFQYTENTSDIKNAHIHIHMRELLFRASTGPDIYILKYPFVDLCVWMCVLEKI